MSQLKEITQEDVVFGKEKAPLYEKDLKFGSDVPPIIRLAMSIQDLLNKMPMIPLVCSFDLEEKTGTRLFGIKDKRNMVHLFTNQWVCDVLHPNTSDQEKLDSIFSQLKCKETMTLFREAYRVGFRSAESHPLKLLSVGSRGLTAVWL